jgi:thiol-disulfide isomerase/thioredoxin
MAGRREVLVLGGVGLAAAVVGAFLGPVALQFGSGASDLLAASFPDAAGRPQRLNQWRGKPLVLNFWATWCAPCREEVPLLVEFHREYAAKGVEMVGICADQAVKMLEFASIYKMRYTLLVADASVFTLLRKIGDPAGALPYSVVLDRKGAVVYRHAGALKHGELEKIVDPILG